MNEDMNTPNVRGFRHLPAASGVLTLCLQVRREHFVTAAKMVRRRITPEVIQEYEEWRDRSGVRSA